MAFILIRISTVKNENTVLILMHFEMGAYGFACSPGFGCACLFLVKYFKGSFQKYFLLSLLLLELWSWSLMYCMLQLSFFGGWGGVMCKLIFMSNPTIVEVDIIIIY